jgi:hypothetical protein
MSGLDAFVRRSVSMSATATARDISPVVDLVKGVHARIRRADFPDSGGWPSCPRIA